MAPQTVDTVQTATCPGRTAPNDCPRTRVTVAEADELELGAPCVRVTVLAGCIECEGACFIIPASGDPARLG